MQEIPNEPKAIVETAIANEIEGHRILSDAMKNASDPRAKATLEFLANQELQHIELIKSFAQSLDANQAWTAPELNELTPEEVRSQIRGIFERFAIQFEDASILPEAHLEIYDVALEMERRGYDYYLSASRKMEDENAKRLFNFLAKEEQRHFDIIQDTHDFLSNPAGYLAWEERWMQT